MNTSPIVASAAETTKSRRVTQEEIGAHLDRIRKDVEAMLHGIEYLKAQLDTDSLLRM